MKRIILSKTYQHFVKPIFFKTNPERIHDFMVSFGKILGSNELSRLATKSIFNYESPRLEKEVLGIKFKNPVGLSAGFDYNANLMKILPSVGFGFSSVGTITNLPYEGNKPPRLVRLHKSQSLLVNKGFKNDGVDAILKRLNDSKLENITFGVSVGSSNLPEIDTINLAIDDYVACFTKLKSNKYIKYYELNISCPNICMSDTFTDIKNFEPLVQEISKLGLQLPIFVKMPNELNFEKSDLLVDASLKYGIRGFIFANLAKDRNTPHLHSYDKEKITKLQGNLSGKPTEENSNNLIRYFRNKYKNDIAIIGVGGIFSPEDALKKFNAGADLVQLITGMIFIGPQLAGDICFAIDRKVYHGVADGT